MLKRLVNELLAGKKVSTTDTRPLDAPLNGKEVNMRQ